jgi:hypothetical protein
MRHGRHGAGGAFRILLMKGSIVIGSNWMLQLGKLWSVKRLSNGSSRLAGCTSKWVVVIGQCYIKWVGRMAVCRGNLRMEQGGKERKGKEMETRCWERAADAL